MTEKRLSYDNQRVVNAAFVMEALLSGQKAFIKSSGSCQCPFHEDSKCSAKIFDDNSIYCWVCCRKYQPYDVLFDLMGLSNMKIIQAVKAAGKWIEPPRERKKPFTLFSE